MTTRFSNFGFAADPTHGATRLRTLQDRLSYDGVINVKDWGAVGNGSNNDSTAIMNAIHFALQFKEFGSDASHGAIVYFPPGVYWLGGTVLSVGNTSDFANASCRLVGAGRDATILKGDNPQFLLFQAWQYGSTGFFGCTDMTLWNINTTLPVPNSTDRSAAAGSGAFATEGMDFGYWARVRFKGVSGFVTFHDIYNCAIENCIAEAQGPDLGVVTYLRADAATQIGQHPFNDYAIAGKDSTHPFLGYYSIPGTCGFGQFQGTILACQAVGFDIGFGSDGPGLFISGCTAERCRLGFAMGLASCGSSNAGPGGFSPSNLAAGGSEWFANTALRCRWGFYFKNTGLAAVGANVTAGATGPTDPMPISGLSWNPANRIVTVATASPHNIAVGAQMLDLVGLVPPAFTPDGSGSQTVMCSYQDATHFTYNGPATNPNPSNMAVSGAWNYPIEHGIVAHACNQVTLMSNVAATATAKEFIDFTDYGYNDYTGAVELCAMSGAIKMPVAPDTQWPGAGAGAQITISHEMCPGIAPFGLLAGGGGEIDGATVIDAQARNFGEVLAAYVQTATDTPDGQAYINCISVPAGVVAGMYLLSGYCRGGPYVQITSVSGNHLNTAPSSEASQTIPAGTWLRVVAGKGSNRYKAIDTGGVIVRAA
jgi:hypothetical protein